MKKTDAEPARPRGRPRSFDRDKALERAMHVFWRQGYESTSIHDLTAAMRINPPSLYAAFGNKERLFLEAVERYRCGPGGLAESALTEEPTARRAIARLLDGAAAELTRSGRPAGCMFVTSALNGSADAARVRAVLAERRAAAEGAVRARISRGIRDGELPAGADAAALARFYMTVLQGMTVQARDGATRAELRAVVASAMRAWPTPSA